jgi:hypothetical protein
MERESPPMLSVMTLVGLVVALAAALTVIWGLPFTALTSRVARATGGLVQGSLLASALIAALVVPVVMAGSSRGARRFADVGLRRPWLLGVPLVGIVGWIERARRVARRSAAQGGNVWQSRRCRSPDRR